MSVSPPANDPMAVLQSLLAAIEAKSDYFTLLQLPRNAEPLQIRDAYFRLAKQVHPDHPLFSGNPQLRGQATRVVQAITAANATLGDPLRRGAYIHTMMQAAAERSDALSTQLQANRTTTPMNPPLRPTGASPVAVDVVPMRWSSGQLTPTGLPTGQMPSAPGSVNRPMVAANLSGTGQFARPVLTGQYSTVQTPAGQPIVGPGQTNLSNTDRFARGGGPAVTGVNVAPVSGQFQRPSALGAPVGATGQFQRPTSSGQAAIGPTTSPSMQSRATPSMRGLEPPPTEEVARIYLHSGRQQLNRRDWAGAQEALELALPLLTGNEHADCKVMLGWAIFNNNANPEALRIERPKAMWNEVATQFAKSQFHAQAAYYLAVWHKLHGELRHVMGNLQTCLTLQPNHIEAAREKRLMEQRRSNLAEMQELEHREKQLKTRRASTTAVPVGKPTPAASMATGKKVALTKEQSWLERLFGGEKK